jgi:putative ABC transport system permease protein
MEPRKVLTMMDGLDELNPEQLEDLKIAIDKMEKNVKAIVVGKERLRIINKRVGDKIKITSINYQDLEFEFEIIAEFPEGRYDQSAVMHRDYLTNAMKAYERSHNGPHPQANNCLNLIWVRLPNKEAFERMAAVVNEPGKFSSPAVKMETASSAINSFLDGFRDILNAMRWGLCPAIVACMTLVIANAISISVRERLKEMAVLKVLGFRPWMVMSLVLGEALLIGGLSGGLSSFFAWVLTTGQGGVKFPIAFFPSFMLPNAALWWGPLLGILTALAGSILPALAARRIKASEVFAQVT